MNDNVSNSKKLNLIILILIVVIAIASLMGAYALYTTVQNKTINVPIAGWQFKVDGKLQNSGEIGFAMTRLDTNNQVKEGMVAPGTYGEFPIYVDVTGVDTAIEYSIDIDIINKSTNLKFYGKRTGAGIEGNPYKYDYEMAVKDITAQELDAVKTGRTVIKGYMSLAEVEEVKEQAKNEGKTQAVREETIYWEWPYEYDVLVNNLNAEGYAGAYAKTAMNKYDETDTKDILNEDGSAKQVTMSITAKGTQSLKEPEKYIVLADGKKVPLTEENAANYYGAEVNIGVGSANIYRLFYVDFEDEDGDGIGKYGDPVGTIYLKADSKKDWNKDEDGIKLSDQLTNEYLNNVNIVNTKFIKMNPQWANYGSNKSRDISTYSNSEKGALWLADQNVWKDILADDIAMADDIAIIKNKYNINNDDYIYAIGGPSLEMYIDSYNASQGYERFESKVISKVTSGVTCIGYTCEVVGNNYWTNWIGWYTLNTYRNGMYSNTEREQKWWWLASPSYVLDKVCNITNNSLSIDSYDYDNSAAISPIVSLTSNTFLELK